MLTSILNIYSEFFKLFGDKVTVMDFDEPIEFPVHYAKDSKDDLTQNFIEKYPQISIIDYAPEINPMWGKSYQRDTTVSTKRILRMKHLLWATK